jgi:ATP-binding cassette, subfamily F, member 3
LGSHVAVHFYAQHQLDALDPDHTVLEELEGAAPDAVRTRLRTLLGSFLFTGDAVDKKVRVLSGGEKARVALARMLVRPAALLCLDEPTNHLDLASREVLEMALATFPGTIVFISHDRYFINRIGTRIVEVADGRLTTYLGTYDDYLDAKARLDSPSDADPGARPAKRPSPASPAVPAPERPRSADGPARPAAPSRKVSGEVRKLRVRLTEVERQIHALEARLEEIGGALADPALYADGDRVRAITGERKSAEEKVAWLMREWEDLSTELAAHE